MSRHIAFAREVLVDDAELFCKRYGHEKRPCNRLICHIFLLSTRTDKPERNP